MTLLFAILLFAPMPKPGVPTLAIVPPSQTITLEWDNSPTPGCSNRLCWGESPVALTNRFEVGVTNQVHVNVDTTRRYYTVRAVLGGIESEQCNIVKWPGDTIREFYAVKPDGEKVVLGATTNVPPGDSGYFRVNWVEWRLYDHE